MSSLGRVWEHKNGFWYYGWNHRGEEYRKSSGTKSEKLARRMLRETLRKLDAGWDPSDDKLLFKDMIERVRQNRLENGTKGDDTDQRLTHLNPFFEGMRASEITTASVDRYKRVRVEEGAKAATINRELALLRRAFNLCQLVQKPTIRLFSERGNERQDFLGLADFYRVLELVPVQFRDFLAFCYHSSWRQGQVAQLEWRDVDFNAGVITARGETTKGGESHRIPVAGELVRIIQRAREERQLDCPYVFHVYGKPIALHGSKSPIRVAWAYATREAGFTGHVMHCMRRSGIRNNIQAGVDPMTAMAISGHKTMSMLRRYNIISPDDMKRALERTQAHLAEPQESKVVSLTGKLPENKLASGE